MLCTGSKGNFHNALMPCAGSKGNFDSALVLCAGSKGKAKTEGESEDDMPFMAQEERRPVHRARKTMQLQDVDSKLRDMRYALFPLGCGFLF
jgi:hypothetical protein